VAFDFYNTPNAIDKGHTINGYWMEQSGGGEHGAVPKHPTGGLGTTCRRRGPYLAVETDAGASRWEGQSPRRPT
jgi:hypothetical protein